MVLESLLTPQIRKSKNFHLLSNRERQLHNGGWYRAGDGRLDYAAVSSSDSCQPPKSWSLEQRGKWAPFPLYVTDEYGLRRDQYNVVHPAAKLECDAFRIRMTPRGDACVGILEIDVVFEED